MNNQGQLGISNTNRLGSMTTKKASAKQGSGAGGDFADILAQSAAKSQDNKAQVADKKPDPKPNDTGQSDTQPVDKKEPTKEADQDVSTEPSKEPTEQPEDAQTYISQVLGLVLTVPIVAETVTMGAGETVASDQAVPTVAVALTDAATVVELTSSKDLTATQAVPVMQAQAEPNKNAETRPKAIATPTTEASATADDAVLGKAAGDNQQIQAQTDGQEEGNLTEKSSEPLTVVQDAGEDNPQNATPFNQVLKNEGDMTTIKVNDSSSLLQRQVTQQVNDKIVSQFQNGRQQFTMTLNPDRLGQISVKMAFEGGQMVVHVETQNPLAQNLLSGNIAELKSILQNNGVQVSEVNVSQFAGDGHTGYEEPKHSQEQNNERQSQQGQQTMDQEVFEDEVVAMTAEGGLNYSV